MNKYPIIQNIKTHTHTPSESEGGGGLEEDGGEKGKSLIKRGGVVCAMLPPLRS